MHCVQLHTVEKDEKEKALVYHLQMVGERKETPQDETLAITGCIQRSTRERERCKIPTSARFTQQSGPLGMSIPLF